MFVTLKEFAEAKGQPGLQDYIAKQWQNCGVKKTESLADVFEQGLALILLDGLDEVQEKEHDRVLQEIKDFTGQFRDCQFVMTCRIAAREYVFQQFTEVEVADFDTDQIAEFATKWFKAKKDDKKAETFIQRLDNNKPIQELATNPLLLTLLCLVFGEAADFPANRSELYKEGLDVLLKKWDAKRNIERDQIYKKLSLQRKEDLLSQLAFYTFDRGDYFFKQAVAERHIIDYIRNLPGAQDDEAALQLDGADVLNSIEAQHGLLVERAKGIYSFSHLTFQEYFAAKQITRPTARLPIALNALAQHISEERYREIFLLAIGILPEADELLKLMKYRIDQILASEPSLQDFLDLVNRQTQSANISFKNTAARAFLLYLTIGRELSEDIFDNVSRLVLDSRLSLALGLNDKQNLIVVFVPHICFGLDNGSRLKLNLTPKFKYLQEKLPITAEFGIWAKWWKEQGKSLLKDLQSVQINNNKHILSLQFTETQKEKLQQYYNANKLLIECLNSDCYVTKATRQEIEETLLLPISEIKKRQGE